MKILVTGGSGFIGRRAIEVLAEAGHLVVAPTRQPPARPAPGVERLACRSLEEMTLADWLPLLAGVDAVFHAAAIAHIGLSIPVARYQAVNGAAAGVLAEAARAAGVRDFVFLSSIRAQVGPHSSVPLTEDLLPRPTEAYGESKLMGERLVREAFREAIILRPSLVVGSGSAGNLPVLERLARLPLPLPFGAFSAPQAMVARDNLVSMVQHVLSHPQCRGETFVCADEPHPSIADVIRWLRQGAGRPPGLLPVPAALLQAPMWLVGKSEVHQRLSRGLVISSAKLRRHGWAPVVSLEETFVAMGAGRAV